MYLEYPPKQHHCPITTKRIPDKAYRPVKPKDSKYLLKKAKEIFSDLIIEQPTLGL